MVKSLCLSLFPPLGQAKGETEHEPSMHYICTLGNMYIRAYVHTLRLQICASLCVHIAPSCYPLLPAVVSLVVVVLLLITCVALLALALKH